jgi:hypothetical protein
MGDNVSREACRMVEEHYEKLLELHGRLKGPIKNLAAKGTIGGG